MNTFRKYTQAFACAVALLGASACADSFLDKKPLDQLTDVNFYKTEADAIFAINAVYDVLQWDGHTTPSGHFRWFFGDIVSDDATKGGSGDNDVFSLLQLETFTARPDNELVASEWNADYQGIYRANLVITHVPAIVMNETLKARILGEAKFMRAYFYYNLVTIFGDVPLVTSILEPSQYNIPRTPKAQVWALIEEDLKEAAAVLPQRSQYSAADLGRITKGAANGMLLRVYAFQNKWTDALPVAETVVSSGEYQLVADYSSIFTLAGENNSESVFEIQFMNASNGNWGDFREGTLTNVFQRARGDFGGFGFNIPTQNFVDEFEPNDPRLSATVFRVGDAMGDRGIFTKEATGMPHDYYAKKYFSNQSETAVTGDPAVNGGGNDRVIRYSDILLMHAEAAHMTGDENKARTSLNIVRSRVGMSPVNATGDALLAAIWHERRVELGLEGHRFFDLIRQGRVGNVMRATAEGKGFKNGTHEVFPVPLSQIQATNGTISQNPGY